MRVVDARRSLLLSSTRRLQTASELAQVERLRQEFVAAPSGWMISGASNPARAAGRQHQDCDRPLPPRSCGRKADLCRHGAVAARARPGKQAGIIVFRTSDKGRERRVVEEDTELLPGDVVEVSLQGARLPVWLPVSPNCEPNERL